MSERTDTITPMAVTRGTMDGWTNALNGIGHLAFDPRLQTKFGTQYVYEVPQAEARSLWRGYDIAAKAIEKWPDEMVRAGWRFQCDDKNISEKIDTWLEEQNIASLVWRALAYKRAYGGSGLLLGANDGSASMSEPLNIDRVREYQWTTILEAMEFYPSAYYANPAAPKFGEPGLFAIQPVIAGNPMPGTMAPPRLEVHESRLIYFDGIKVSRYATPSTMHGDSILTRIYTVLRDFGTTWDAASILVHDFSVAMIKIKNMAEAMATDNDDAIRSRMEMVARGKSVANALFLDSEEDYERKSTTLTGLPELMVQFMYRLAAACDMPVTLLMGMSPGGLNATGDSDIRLFYDRIAAAQQRELTPVLERFARIAFKVLGIQEPETWSFKFNPLWQEPESVQATTRKTQAETDAIYMDRGVLAPQEVANSRFGGDQYSYETQIDTSLTRELPAPEPSPFEDGGEEPQPDEEPEPKEDSRMDSMPHIEHRGKKWVVVRGATVIGSYSSPEAARQHARRA